MGDGEVGDDDDVDGLRSIAEVRRDGLLDVALEFVEGAALGKDVHAQAARAPVLAVKVGLKLDQHVRQDSLGESASQNFLHSAAGDHEGDATDSTWPDGSLVRIDCCLYGVHF